MWAVMLIVFVLGVIVGALLMLGAIAWAMSE